MGAGPKIRASAARSHTRKAPAKTSSRKGGGLGLLGLVMFSTFCAILSWVAYKSILPPAVKICGTPNGPPVTAPRIELRDGRFLAYKEDGVSKDKAKYKIVAVHGYGGSRHALLGGLSKDVIKKLGIYIVGYDRAGYGQSTPYPQRSVESEAFDVQDLADGLKLGSTFYVAVTSIGGYTGYSLLKYLPHRVAGMVMFAPVTNFWWTGFPQGKAQKAFDRQVVGDRLALRVAHYAPWLVYWYMTQTWFPTSSTVALERSQLDAIDRQRITEYYEEVHAKDLLEPTQQGKDVSQFRDMQIMFGTWDFEPFDLENPFVGRSGAVHIWQGDMDYLVPAMLQREVAQHHSWIHYHEVPGAGHGLLGIPGLADEMIRTLLVGKN